MSVHTYCVRLCVCCPERGHYYIRQIGTPYAERMQRCVFCQLARAASCAAQVGRNNTILVHSAWGARPPACPPLKGHVSAVTDLCFAPTGRLLVRALLTCCAAVRIGENWAAVMLDRRGVWAAAVVCGRDGG